MAGQIAYPKENKSLAQNQSKAKTKHGIPQNRVSVVGPNGIPAIIVNQLGQVPQQQTTTNYKTFYNWNTNADYNYKIDVEKKDGGAYTFYTSS